MRRAVAFGIWMGLAVLLGCGKSRDATTKASPKAKAQAKPESGEGKAGEASAKGDEVASLFDKEGRTFTQRIQAKLPPSSPVHVRWALDVQGRRIESLWFPDESERLDYILILTDRHDLIAIERRTGLTKWWTRLAGPITGDPGFTPFSILVAVKNRLICMERGSGNVRWQVLLPIPPACGPAAQEDKEGAMNVFLAGLDRRLYGYAVKIEVWPPEGGAGSLTRDDLQMDRASLDRIWQYPTYGALCDRIAYREGKLIACDWAGYVYGINTLSGITGKPTDVWTRQGRKSFVVGPTLAGPAVIAPCEDQGLYCLGRNDGGVLWRYIAADALETRAQIAVDPNLETTLIVQKVGKKGPLIALPEMGSQDPLWEIPGAKKIVARFDYPGNAPKQRCVFAVEDDEGELQGIYAQSGEKAWTLPGKLFDRFCANTYDSVILATCEENRILCAIERTP